MEPSGGTQWQSVANAPSPEPSTKPKPLPLVATVADENGKEGVCGSSPQEGFRRYLLISLFVARTGDSYEASARRPRAFGIAEPVGLKVAP